MFNSYYFFPIVLFNVFFGFIFSSSFIFIQPISYGFVYDEVSFFMTYLLVFVLLVAYILSLSFGDFFKLNFVFLVLFLSCFLVFCSSDLFLIYLSYEASLLPIIYIILKWGSYPERSLSSIMLLLYTSLFTLPFFLVLFVLFNNIYSFKLYYGVFGFSLSPTLSLIIFFTFAVKLPIYGLHYWLPMAHVEAPTFGSVILAGVLLNLGGVGLLRFASFVDFIFLNSSLLSYLVIFLVYSSVICLWQSDFKRLIAYSSVSHMMCVPLLFLANSIISIQTYLMLLFLHGLSSSILFMLVGVVYSLYSTRQLVLIRGLFLLNPLLGVFTVLTFFFSVSAPPFPSFVMEVYFFFSSCLFHSWFLPFFLILIFLSFVYNLNWFISLCFGGCPSLVGFSSEVSFSVFLSFYISFFMCISFSLLIGCL